MKAREARWLSAIGRGLLETMVEEQKKVWCRTRGPGEQIYIGRDLDDYDQCETTDEAGGGDAGVGRFQSGVRRALSFRDYPRIQDIGSRNDGR